MFTHYLSITGCEKPGWYADGECDDVNNNEACFFDGGDCCGSNVNTQYCNICQCLEEGGGNDCNAGWIADGYCDDINNNLDCSYDGGDCCGSNVNTHCYHVNFLAVLSTPPRIFQYVGGYIVLKSILVLSTSQKKLYVTGIAFLGG